MKKIVGFAIILLMCIACREMKTEIIQEKPPQDWITLFNGSSFDHWRGYLSDEMYQEWTIEDSLHARLQVGALRGVGRGVQPAARSSDGSNWRSSERRIRADHRRR